MEDSIQIAGKALLVGEGIALGLQYLSREEMGEIVAADTDKIVPLLERRRSFESVEDFIGWIRTCLADLKEKP